MKNPFSGGIPHALIAVLVALGLSVAVAVATPPSPEAAAPVKKPVIIPLYLSSRRILVMLRVGDHLPVPVVFDTGTNSNLVDLKFAKELSLPRTGDSKSIDGSTGKPVPGFEGRLVDARLGGVKIEDGPVTVLDYPMMDEVGIFCPNSFPGHLVLLDCGRSALKIEEKTPATIPAVESFPYDGKDDDKLPAVPIDIAGLRLTAELDSGNDSALLLPTSYISKLPLEAPPVVIGEATSVAGKQPLYRARLKGSIHIASVTLENPNILFIAGGIPNIGLPILRQLSVVFDPSEGRTWILGPATVGADRPH